MKSIKLFTSVIAALLLSSSVMAQDSLSDDWSPEERAKNLTEWMKIELGIDTSLVETVHIINLKYAIKIENLKMSHSGRVKKFRELRSLSSNKDRELKKVLTKDQFKVYEKKKEEMRINAKSKYQGNQF